MSRAAWAFEQVPFNLPRMKPVRRPRILARRGDLEEIPVVPDATGFGRSEEPRIRAFRVLSGFQRLGLQAGDCLLVHAKERVEPKDLVVIEREGAFSARRVVGRRGDQFTFDPPVDETGCGKSHRVIGGFAGILRKRLMPSCRPEENTNTARHFEAASAKSRTTGRAHYLRSKLGMVESTCAETANPRLRRALRLEAASLRRQLQNEASPDKFT